MCSPSATLTVWAGSWLAGRSAPDDVLDALRAWSPQHSVAAGDPLTGGRTGLPWPSAEPLEAGTGIMVLLKVIREAMAEPGARMRLVLPVPGDARGLPAGTEFATAAMDAEEGVIAGVPGGEGVALVPQWTDEESLQWTVFHTPVPVPAPDMALGEAEYAMREAVREAAEALMRLHTTAIGGDDDPRELIEAELAACSRHIYPDSAPLRARRILDSADHVAAILTVAQQTAPSSPSSASAVQAQETLLRPLWSALRAARLAAVNAAAGPR
ncbi:hypothetical protein [Nocardia sp. AB354]|uniref:hypothetical protein n=1 Tax=Nocardia sp. AB354 TaxID=3413283 RepID=UPI003C283817